jgi:hypothetical protein
MKALGSFETSGDTQRPRVISRRHESPVKFDKGTKRQEDNLNWNWPRVQLTDTAVVHYRIIVCIRNKPHTTIWTKKRVKVSTGGRWKTRSHIDLSAQIKTGTQITAPWRKWSRTTYACSLRQDGSRWSYGCFLYSYDGSYTAAKGVPQQRRRCLICTPDTVIFWKHVNLSWRFPCFEDTKITTKRSKRSI